jgi:DNA-binding NtrC family response regulator
VAHRPEYCNGVRVEEAHAMHTDPLLIVSRDTQRQDGLVFALRRARVGAVSADDAHDAVALLQWQPFRAVIIDVERAADWPMCQAIAGAAAIAGAPALAMCAWTAPDGRSRDRAFESGCAAFASKPCSVDTLLRTVERLDNGERRFAVMGRL